jgi:hypothetical protein
MKMKIVLLIVTISLSNFSFGQSAKLSREENDSIAKNQVPIPGKAIVYIIRPGYLGAAIEMRLDCDSFFVGRINSKTYLFTILDSGDHIFKAQAENNFNLKIHLDGGKVYYLEQDAKMGILFARTKLKIIAPEEGTKYLSKFMISGKNNYPHITYSRDVIESTSYSQ